WGGFDPFLAYTGKLLWFLPTGLVSAAGWAATVLEGALAVGLVAGGRRRGGGPPRGGPVLVVCVPRAGGPRAPPPRSCPVLSLPYSVWSAAAGAFLLASLRPAAGAVGAGGEGRSLHRGRVVTDRTGSGLAAS